MGGEPLEGPEFPGGHYVRPCIASAQNSFGIVQEETFAPILYIIGYGDVTACRKESADELAEAMQLHNDVPQGLSSAIFTGTSGKRSTSCRTAGATAASPT